MGINLSAVMLLIGVGRTQDVKECGKIRILGFYVQDTTPSFSGCLGPGLPFEKEVSDFMDKADSVYPGSMFGVYGFRDRMYDNRDPTKPTTKQEDDYVKITSLVDVPTAQTQISKLAKTGGTGGNSGAFDVMYHLIVDNSDSGIDKVTPLADTYDAKVLYVFTDGIPQYLESTTDGCQMAPGVIGNPCMTWCGADSTKCCSYDESTDVHTPDTSKVDYGTKWNSSADCPIDLATLGKVIKDNDWYVAYIAAGDGPNKRYDWSMQVPLMGIESRFTYYGISYSYKGLSDALVDITSKIMCSAVPSNNPSGLPTGGPTVAPTTSGGGETTTAPATGPTAGGPTTAASTGGSTTAPTTGGSTSGPTRSGQGGTTTTTTKKPFPIGLVCGCAAGALVAIAGGTVAANRLTGWPPMPEFEFEGDEGEGHEEVERETQVALGEADYA